LIFVFSCLAIVPLAALLGLGTEQIAIRTSQSFGGLLNATLGNIIEMIIAGIALKQVSYTHRYTLVIINSSFWQCELELVQSSLLGGLLSNLLLVLGMAFIGTHRFDLYNLVGVTFSVVGGFRFPHQEFQPMVAQLNSSLMIVCVTSLILPVALASTLSFQVHSRLLIYHI
jgi:Ca2+:H+ antiporter